MNKQLKTIGLFAILLLVLAMIGSGVAFALTQGQVSEVAQELNQVDAEAGILIASVVPNGPAAKAGLVRGDILLKIDDISVNHSAELVDYLHNLESTQEVNLTIRHGDEERLLTVTPGEQNERPYLGIVPCGGLQNKAVHIIRDSSHMGDTGIEEVVPDSPAAQAGLQEGDVIIAVNDQTLDEEHDLAEVIAAYEPDTTVTLTIQRDNEEENREVQVQLGEHPNKEGVAYLGVAYRLSIDIEFTEQGLPGMTHFEHMPFNAFEFELLPDGIEQGHIIEQVADDSPAARVGLKPEVIITAINGEALKSEQDIVDTIAKQTPGSKITLSTISLDDNNVREVDIVLAEHPDDANKAYLGVALGGFFQRTGPNDFSFFLEKSLPSKELRLNLHKKIDGNNSEVEIHEFFDDLDLEEHNFVPHHQFDGSIEYEMLCDRGENCFNNSI